MLLPCWLDFTLLVAAMQAARGVKASKVLPEVDLVYHNDNHRQYMPTDTIVAQLL